MRCALRCWISRHATQSAACCGHRCSQSGTGAAVSHCTHVSIRPQALLLCGSSVWLPDYTETPYVLAAHAEPFAHTGVVSISYGDGYLSSEDAALDVPIEQLQLEQDTGKSIYAATDSGSHISLLDYNRAGVALVEIVSAPVLRTSEQAGAYVRKLRQLLRCVGASNGNMNEGSLRCDANVSVRRKGEPLGTRCEIKNLNSVKFMMHALGTCVALMYQTMRSSGSTLY